MIWGIFLLIAAVAGIVASGTLVVIAGLLLWEWFDKLTSMDKTDE